MLSAEASRMIRCLGHRGRSVEQLLLEACRGLQRGLSTASGGHHLVTSSASVVRPSHSPWARSGPSHSCEDAFGLEGEQWPRGFGRLTWRRGGCSRGMARLPAGDSSDGRRTPTAVIDRLADYKAKHGDLLVPRVYQDDPYLGRWVSIQRQRWARGNLPEEIHQQLQGLDFVWDAQEYRWGLMLDKLKQFRSRHGHCLVPRDASGADSLGFWVHNQRVRRKWLKPSRAERLEALGFEWDPYEAAWAEKFHQLKEFKRQHGHVLVRISHPGLGAWVHTQRKSRKAMRSQRLQELDALGFVWEAQEAAWETRFLELQLFREMHGHCLVRLQHRGLGPWLHKQRTLFRAGSLRKDRLQRLEAIGMVWHVKKKREAGPA